MKKISTLMSILLIAFIGCSKQKTHWTEYIVILYGNFLPCKGFCMVNFLNSDYKYKECVSNCKNEGIIYLNNHKEDIIKQLKLKSQAKKICSRKLYLKEQPDLAVFYLGLPTLLAANIYDYTLEALRCGDKYSGIEIRTKCVTDGITNFIETMKKECDIKNHKIKESVKHGIMNALIEEPSNAEWSSLFMDALDLMVDTAFICKHDVNSESCLTMRMGAVLLYTSTFKRLFKDVVLETPQCYK